MAASHFFMILQQVIAFYIKTLWLVPQDVHAQNKVGMLLKKKKRKKIKE